jgi:hypothetical protein
MFVRLPLHRTKAAVNVEDGIVRIWILCEEYRGVGYLFCQPKPTQRNQVRQGTFRVQG